MQRTQDIRPNPAAAQQPPAQRPACPTPLSTAELQRVAGGLPKGGWGSCTDSVYLPKGGW
jgi:hypothetical protein